MASLLMICGSLRKASQNRMLLEAAGRLWTGKAEMASIDMPVYNGDDEDQSGLPKAAQLLVSQITAADAVLIGTPEYNQSIPGGLKNAFDWVSRVEGKPWADKPVAIVSAAAGRAGGARAQYALRLAMTPFQPRLLTGPEVMVAAAHKEFNGAGELISEAYQKTLRTLLEKLAAEANRG
ncbi:NAD(P)H-dependent oxidoreductase [Rhodobacteraceae bacterium]|nr:NAD(P)H-dependent oxidoreductase [Paracoccaceae bacterium]